MIIANDTKAWAAALTAPSRTRPQVGRRGRPRLDHTKGWPIAMRSGRVTAAAAVNGSACRYEVAAAATLEVLGPTTPQVGISRPGLAQGEAAAAPGETLVLDGFADHAAVEADASHCATAASSSLKPE